MLFEDKEYVLNEIVKCQFPYYEVLDGQIPKDEMQDPGTTPEKSAENLRTYLDSVQGSGFLTVKVSMKNRKERGAGRDYSMRIFNIKMNGGTSSSIAGTQNNSPGISNRELDLMNTISQLQLQLKQTEFNQQMDFLKKEIADLKENKSDGIGALAESLLVNYLNHTQQPGAQVAIHGMDEVATAPAATDNKQRFAEAVKVLQTIDKDFIGTIEALANFAKKNPADYVKYMTMLKLQ